MPSRGGKPDKLMRDSIILELHQEAADTEGGVTKKLRLVARRLVNAALEGDIAAIKEINDRVDGRPPQTIQGDADNPLVIERVMREIVDPAQKSNPWTLPDASDPRAA
jgi:hypothetical protein